jgi:hypothetical protein
MLQKANRLLTLYEPVFCTENNKMLPQQTQDVNFNGHHAYISVFNQVDTPLDKLPDYYAWQR